MFSILLTVASAGFFLCDYWDDVGDVVIGMMWVIFHRICSSLFLFYSFQLFIIIPYISIMLTPLYKKGEPVKAPSIYLDSFHSVVFSLSWFP